MSLFIKTEQFTQDTLRLLPEQRHAYLAEHKFWVEKLKSTGKKLASGYLVNEEKCPGGGGLLVIEANCFEEAKLLVEQDPMVKNNLVTWELQEWIPVTGQLLS
ncbi:YciI family protein [Prochlorococcus marinus]|uniref:Uncharacterized protein conserved in bacteria n=1 Tax=Prochlorococcus marinus (strain MIT 9211) TaxID=93059 RepID=A9BCK5_PROM4|nr:YciI family protein [Prochlorococcus marinus]ABX09567.1 Uncharacterized protein conserved in bacteria [Prochlorococcus marinus str. MIT 9211]